MSDLLDLIRSNLVPFGLALLIGIVAGRWAFRRPPAAADQPKQDPSES